MQNDDDKMWPPPEPLFLSLQRCPFCPLLVSNSCYKKSRVKEVFAVAEDVPKIRIEDLTNCTVFGQHLWPEFQNKSRE